MKTIIVTREMLDTLNACNESKVVITDNDMWGKTETEVLNFFIESNLFQYNEWWLKKKQTEEFVRYNGEVITMGEYKVFNPLTGQHTTFLTEAEAKAALIEISKDILEKHTPRIVQAMRNENGDETWIPTDIHKTIQII